MEKYHGIIRAVETWGNILAIYDNEVEICLHIFFNRKINIIKGLSKLQCQNHLIMSGNRIRNTPFCVKVGILEELVINENEALLILEHPDYYTLHSARKALEALDLELLDVSFLDNKCKCTIIEEWIELSGTKLVSNGLFISSTKENYMIDKEESEIIHELWNRIV